MLKAKLDENEHGKLEHADPDKPTHMLTSRSERWSDYA